jgi:predicted PurR-regulated permease PerM
MLPEVPVSVWDQIPIVVIFTLLLGGLSFFMVKAFSKAVADINSYYAQMVEKSNTQYAQALRDNNEQWQRYFDARSELSSLINAQIVKRLEGVTEILSKLIDDFERHDQWERQAIEDLTQKPAPAKRNRNQ